MRQHSKLIERLRPPEFVRAGCQSYALPPREEWMLDDLEMLLIVSSSRALQELSYSETRQRKKKEVWYD